MYCILEGVDTSGKSTQIELLKDLYPDACFTKEPGGTDIGVKLREMILFEGGLHHKTELFLFLADRSEHYQRIVKTHNVIFSDRGFISGIAYALANHKEYDLDFLADLNRFALEGKLPDYVILLQTNETLIKERLGQKSEDVIEKRGIDYLLHVQSLMQEVLEKLQINYIAIDASKKIEEIHKEIKGFIA